MGTKVGLWIDHKRAVVVALTEHGEVIGRILSKVEKQGSRSGEVPYRHSFESHRVPADDNRQRALTEHLKHYYSAVTACIGDADYILLFGPGEAKGELKKHLEQKGMRQSIVGMETVDKMTDRQIAAKVRERFAD